jgi:hypothetical protein
MEANACLGCRFGSVKINISVPQKCDEGRLARETKAFASKIAVMTRQKPVHYTVTYSERQKFAALDFAVNCSCILNVDKRDCSNYNPSKTCRIMHIRPSKSSSLEVAQKIC